MIYAVFFPLGHMDIGGTVNAPTVKQSPISSLTFTLPHSLLLFSPVAIFLPTLYAAYSHASSLSALLSSPGSFPILSSLLFSSPLLSSPLLSSPFLYSPLLSPLYGILTSVFVLCSTVLSSATTYPFCDYRVTRYLIYARSV